MGIGVLRTTRAQRTVAERLGASVPRISQIRAELEAWVRKRLR